MSSRAVPLIIIPMDVDEQWIEVEAYSSNRNDAIRKSLKVVVSFPSQYLDENSGDLFIFFPGMCPQLLHLISNACTNLH